MYRRLGLNVAGRLRSGCFFDGGDVTIDRDTFVNYECYFDARYAPIRIGPGCSIAPQVMIATTTHEIDHPQRAGRVIGRPVSIGAGCWIGARATILPGAMVGDRCVIAVGAVVTSDCEPDGLYAGVPARRVRDLRGGENSRGEVRNGIGARAG